MSSGHREQRKISGMPNTCTFRDRKRRSDDVPRANEGPKRQRMKGEDVQIIGDGSKPIKFNSSTS